MTDGSAPLDPLEPAAVQGHTDLGTQDGTIHSPEDAAALHARKKRDKVRAAWISFTGRILAQLIGAIATVVLGVYVVRTYGVDKSLRTARPVTGAVEAPSPAAPHDHRSIAVLPFVSYSPGQPDDALCAALTEAVIAQLAQDRGLRVISRTSSMAYRGSAKKLPAIAAELGVDVVLEGSITRMGDRIRITAQLVDASTDTHLWAATFDRTTSNLLDLEEEIPRLVAGEVRTAIRTAPR